MIKVQGVYQSAEIKLEIKEDCINVKYALVRKDIVQYYYYMK